MKSSKKLDPNKYDKYLKNIQEEFEKKKGFKTSTRELPDPNNSEIINRCLTFDSFSEAHICSEWLYDTYSIVSKQTENNPRRAFISRMDLPAHKVNVIVTLREATEIHKLLNNETLKEIQKSLKKKDNIEVEIGLAHDDNKIRTPVLLFEVNKGLKVSKHLSTHFGISADNPNESKSFHTPEHMSPYNSIFEDDPTMLKNISTFKKKIFIKGVEQNEIKILSGIVLSYKKINKDKPNKREEVINQSTFTPSLGNLSKIQATDPQNTQFPPIIKPPYNPELDILIENQLPFNAEPIDNGVSFLNKNKIKDPKIGEFEYIISKVKDCRDASDNPLPVNICSSISKEHLSSYKYKLFFTSLSDANDFCKLAYDFGIGSKDPIGKIKALEPIIYQNIPPMIVLSLEQAYQVRETCNQR